MRSGSPLDEGSGRRLVSVDLAEHVDRGVRRRDLLRNGREADAIVDWTCLRGSEEDTSGAFLFLDASELRRGCKLAVLAVWCSRLERSGDAV